MRKKSKPFITQVRLIKSKPLERGALLVLLNYWFKVGNEPLYIFYA